MKKSLPLILLFPLQLIAQNSKIDTILLSKMIIANVDKAAVVGKSINGDCSLANPQSYISPHKEAPKLAYITDYILCNNGKPNMFFEVFDGNNFIYVSDIQVTFNKDVDSDNMKVLLSRRTAEEKSFLKNNIQQIVDFGREYFIEAKEIEMSEEKKQAIQPFIETEKYGIGLITYNATEGYSSTGAKFKIFNPSKKTIKYIWFTVAGENAVEDLVPFSNGTYYKTFKGIGPIESYGIAAWEFENIWFTDIIEYLRISTIKIQYMDGSTKTVKYNQNMNIGEQAWNHFNEVIDKEENYEMEKNQKEESKKLVILEQDKIYNVVDQAAQFPGGIGAFRGKITDNFNTSVISNITGTRTLVTEITLTVEKDGSISAIMAIGSNNLFNQEAIRTVKMITSKWSPAKINGQSVRSKFRMPLTMNF